jgi:hypothetical protein
MGRVSDETLSRLTDAMERHDVGDLREAAERQIAGGLDEVVARTLIDLVEMLPLIGEPDPPARQAVPPRTMTVRRRGGRQQPIAISDGYYAHPADGRTIKVQTSKTSGYPYAMELVDGKWKFISGLIRELNPAKRAPTPAQTNDQVALNDLVREVQRRREQTG